MSIYSSADTSQITVANLPKSDSNESVPLSYLWALRFILGFQFVSAFARRYINVPSKMDPLSKNFIGGKFSEFMPHAMWPVQPILNAMILHQGLTFSFLVLFSFIELIVGLFLITGTLTRLAAFGAALLCLAILMGAGWMGTSCVDEWQIGTVEGIGAMIFMFTGGGNLSVDHWLRQYWSGTIKLGKISIRLL